MTRQEIKTAMTEFSGSKSSIAYKIAMDIANNDNKTRCVNGSTIRPVYTSGKGRFISNMDYTYDTCKILDLLGIIYETGNDSPRGGKTGNFIKILTEITND